MVTLFLDSLFLAFLCCCSCSGQVDALTFAYRGKKFFGELFDVLVEWLKEVDCKGFFFLFLASCLRGAGVSFGCSVGINYRLNGDEEGKRMTHVSGSPCVASSVQVQPSS